MPHHVRPAREDDVDACVAVLGALPDHFTPSTHDELRASGLGRLAWVAAAEEKVVGFLRAEQRYERTAEIIFAAVLPDHQRSGIGQALVTEAIMRLAELEVAVIEVKTLDASADYEPYVATRRFWTRCGFHQVDCIDPLPGWEPDNPAAIYVAALRSTRPD